MSYEDLFKPTYLKQLAEQHGFRPSKKYGQNYLISRKPIEAMIGAADLTKNDTVVEIGPGFGVLTLALAKKVGRVISFEIEKKLQGYWKEKQQAYENVEIVWGDFIKRFKIEDLRLNNNKYKILANLPYQITSRALRVILEQEYKPEVVVVMVQKEVAERMVAKPGEMSLLSVSVQYFGDVDIVCKVPSGSFWPAPKVDSSIVKIEIINHKSKIINEFTDEQFFRVVKAGFASKRKQLWGNLVRRLGLDKHVVQGVLKDVCGNEKVRAEDLSVKEWKEIVLRLNST